MALCLIDSSIDVNPRKSKRKVPDSMRGSLFSLLVRCVASPQRQPVNLLHVARSEQPAEYTVQLSPHPESATLE